MTLCDVNILISAFRADAPHHQECRTWLDTTVRSDAAFGLSRLALSAVVRITTTRSFLPQPSDLDEVFKFCAELTDQPHCRMVEPSDRHWSIFERLCRDTATTGPRVTDAWYAALAIEHGCEWVTLDRDFARFPELRWRLPG